MLYRFQCDKCGKDEERSISINDYDTEKEKQICECGEKMHRVIEYSGSVSLCKGMYGIDSSGGWNR